MVQQETALLRAAGHEVAHFSANNDDIKGKFSKAVTAILAIYNPIQRSRMAAELNRFRPDVVHVHNWFPRLSPSIFDACRAAGIASVMTLHNFRTLCPTSFLYFDDKLRERSLHHSCFWTVRRRVYRNSYLGTFFVACIVDFHKLVGTWQNKVDRFIVLTEFARRKFIEGGLPSHRMVVKGNCSLRPFPKEKNAAERKGALFVGRLSDEKGIRTLLEAWKDVDYPLRIAGDGPLRALCEAAENGKIRCLGRLSPEDVHLEMMVAAFLVVPSLWYEMFPVVIIEAYARGLPVLVSRLGGLTELVEQRKAGLTFPAGSATELRGRALWAIAHPDEMLALGRRAQWCYEEEFSPEQNCGELLAIYRDAIAARSSSTPSQSTTGQLATS